MNTVLTNTARLTATLGLALAAAAADAFVPAGSTAADSRWLTTASGSTGAAGTPATLTWSIVPDGTLVDSLNNGLQPSDLIADLDAAFGGSASADLRTRPWFRLLDDSFSRWGEVTGLTVLYEPADDGATHGDVPASVGQLGVRGDVRLGGVGLDGSAGTLAYNYFPSFGGDMALDTDDLLTSFSNAAGDYRELRNTIMHELGHGIGLEHIESNDVNVLMEPFVNTGFDGPQHDDLRGAHWLYGDALEKNGGNNTAASASTLGTLAPGGSLAVGTGGNGQFVGQNETDFVSISNENDTDFFSFTIASPVSLDATLTPRGDTYDQFGSQFDTTQTSDVDLTIIDSNGSNVLGQAASQPAGVSESISGLTLASPGTYYARVTGPATPGTVVQFYQLNLSATPAEPALLGDFNSDGVVDAADYTRWRDSENSFVTPFFGADHSGNGVVDAADYTLWRDGFGDTLSASSVPEPATLFASLLTAIALGGSRPRTVARRSVG